MAEMVKVCGENAAQQRQTLVPATVEELQQQVNIIQKAMKTLMKQDTHFGRLPGCGDKQVLLKPGAELIMTLFRIGGEPVVEEFSDGFDVRYRVTIKGFHINTGNVVGYGIGEASTSEKKYKWRAAVCHEEWEATPETRRQIAYSKRYDKVTAVEQVRQNPADILNTVLKMAKKRALVDLCLTATACSDIFVQDLDDPDINAAVNADADTQGRYQAPRQKPAAAPAPQAPAPQDGGNIISEAQRKRLYAIGKTKGLSDEEMSFLVYDIAGVNRSDHVPRDKYDAVVAAFEKAVPGKVVDGGCNTPDNNLV